MRKPKYITYITPITANEKTSWLFAIQRPGQSPFYRRECNEKAEAEGLDQELRFNPRKFGLSEEEIRYR